MDMEIRGKIHEYLKAHKREIADRLKDLIKCPSVRGDAEKNAPFGRDCAEILSKIEKLYADEGFETEKDEAGGYLLSFFKRIGQKTNEVFCGNFARYLRRKVGA